MTAQPARVLRRVGVALVLAAVIALLTHVQFRSNAQEAAVQDPELIAQGNELYGQHCVLCHGGNGLGNGDENDQDYGPPLVNVGGASVDFMIASGRMPASDGRAPLERREPRFTGTERAALVAYVTSLRVPDGFTEQELRDLGIPEEPGAPIPQLGDLDEADLAEGRALFTTNCAACHGPTAAGIAVGQRDVSSNLAGVPPQQVATAIRSGPGVMPLFGPDNLSDEELDAVVAWVDALPNRESPGGVSVGRSGPVTEGMLSWVIGMGLLGVAVYVLGERVGTTEPPDPSDDDGGATA